MAGTDDPGLVPNSPNPFDAFRAVARRHPRVVDASLALLIALAGVPALPDHAVRVPAWRSIASSSRR